MSRTTFETWDRVKTLRSGMGLDGPPRMRFCGRISMWTGFWTRRRRAGAEPKIYVNMQAERAARKQAEIMDRELPDHLLYLVQNAARDILDRAGIREQSEGKQDIHITFGDGMPETGMPESAEGEPDEGTDAGGE